MEQLKNRFTNDLSVRACFENGKIYDSNVSSSGGGAPMGVINVFVFLISLVVLALVGWLTYKMWGLSISHYIKSGELDSFATIAVYVLVPFLLLSVFGITFTKIKIISVGIVISLLIIIAFSITAVLLAPLAFILLTVLIMLVPTIAVMILYYLVRGIKKLAMLRNSNQ